MRRTRLYLTGGTTIEHADGVLGQDRLAGRQGQLVLAALGWHPGSRVERTRLVELLWDDEPPPSWETAIATVVSGLRRALAPAGLEIVTTWGSYELAGPSDLWVDVDTARRALHEAEGALRSGRMDDVFAWSGVATSIARRPLLAGIDGPWLDERRRELREVRMRGLHCAVRFCVWNGETPSAVAYARTLVELDPLREPSYRLLMEAQAAAGDRASAVRTFGRCRRRLADELGMDPDPATRSLYETLLR